MSITRSMLQAAAGGDKLYVYVADYGASAILTVDVTDPTSPSVVATLSDGTDLNQVNYLGIDLTNNVLMAAMNTGRRVAAIDVNSPESLSISDAFVFPNGTFDKHMGSMGLDTANQYAFLAANNNNLQALDYSTPTNLSIAGSYSGSTHADRTRATMYVSSSQGDQSGDYVFSLEVDDTQLTCYDVSNIGAISFERSLNNGTYVGNGLLSLIYDATNVWMWQGEEDGQITAVDMNANGNGIPSGTWDYNTSTARSGSTGSSIQGINGNCLAVDESRKYGFTCGTYQVSTWDFSTSGLTKTPSDKYFNESEFYYGLAYDETNQILYVVENNDFYVFDVSDITNISVLGSINGAFVTGRNCTLGYQP